MAIFTSQFSGSGTTPAESWVSLGTIPTGFKIWLGNISYTTPDKGITFELRTNLATKSLGSTAETRILDTVSLTAKSTSTARYRDLYKAGALHTVTVLGTGVEKLWLRMVSKSSTAGRYTYLANYTLE